MESQRANLKDVKDETCAKKCAEGCAGVGVLCYVMSGL